MIYLSCKYFFYKYKNKDFIVMNESHAVLNQNSTHFFKVVIFIHLISGARCSSEVEHLLMGCRINPH